MNTTNPKGYKRIWIPFALAAIFAGAKYFLFKLDNDRFYVLMSYSTFLMYLSLLTGSLFFLIRRGLVVLANLNILFILLVVSELVFYTLSGMPVQKWKTYSVPDLPEDHIGTHLGHVPWADSVLQDLQTKAGDTLFFVNYSIDKLNRRITPDHDSLKSKYALFFGCSVGFGKGVEDDQTLPFYFQENTDSYNAYNYAFEGWGMHHMLARLEHKDLSKEVSEKDGIAVYVFLWSHIRRAIGDMRVYTEWGHTMPYYKLDKNDKLVRKGNFATGRPMISKFYEIINRSYTVDYLNVNLPFKTKEQHYVLAAEIIAEAKQRYQEQFGNDNFYVLLLPIVWEEFTNKSKNKFLSCLDARNIDYLDYTDSIPLDSNHTIVGDGHPNELAYKKISKLLISDLQAE